MTSRPDAVYQYLKEFVVVKRNLGTERQVGRQLKVLGGQFVDGTLWRLIGRADFPAPRFEGKYAVNDILEWIACRTCINRSHFQAKNVTSTLAAPHCLKCLHLKQFPIVWEDNKARCPRGEMCDEFCCALNGVALDVLYGPLWRVA